MVELGINNMKGETAMAKVIFQHSNHTEEMVAEFPTMAEAKAFVENSFTDDPEEVGAEYLFPKSLLPEGVEILVIGEEGIEMFTNQWEPVRKFSIE